MDSPPCIHHWLIDPPVHPVSWAICKKCGAQTYFANYSEHSAWEPEWDYTENEIENTVR